MKRLNSIELCGLALGILFVVFGVFTIIWPQARVLAHFANDELGLFPRFEHEVVSASRARVYSAVAVLLGVGLIVASLYHERKR